MVKSKRTAVTTNSVFSPNRESPNKGGQSKHMAAPIHPFLSFYLQQITFTHENSIKLRPYKIGPSVHTCLQRLWKWAHTHMTG